MAAKCGHLAVDAMLDSMTSEQFDEWMLSDELDRTITADRRLVKTMANIGEWLLAIEGVDTKELRLIDGDEEINVVQSSAEMLDAMRTTCERHNLNA